MGYSLVPEGYFRYRREHALSAGNNFEHLLPVTDAGVGLFSERQVEYAVTRPHPDADVIADLYLPAGGAFGAPFEFPVGKPPGIVAKSYGKGRVVYFAAPVEKRYFRRGLPELRELIVRAVDYACGGDPVVELSAPPGVVMNLTQAEGAYYLHLLNYNGPMHETSLSVDSITPISDIEAVLRLPHTFRVHSVRRLTNNGDLQFERGDDRLTVRLPKLKIFETIVVMGKREGQNQQG